MRSIFREMSLKTSNQNTLEQEILKNNFLKTPFFENSPDGIFVFDNRLTICAYNKMMAEIFCLEESCVGKLLVDAFKFIPNNDISQIKKVKDGVPFKTLLAFKHPSRHEEPKVYEISFFAHYENNEILGGYGQTREITTISNSRSDNANSFRNFTMNIPGVLYEFIIEPNGHYYFRYISEGCMDMFGYKPEDIRKNPDLLPGLIFHEDRDSYNQSFNRANKLKSAWEWEGRFVVKNEIKRIKGSSKPDRRINGSIVRYGILVDVTEQWKTQLKLQRNEELFGNLFENSPLGIVLADKNYKVSRVNKGFENMFQYNREEIIGKILNDFIVPAEHKGQAIKINQVIGNEGEVVSVESIRRTKNGKLIPVIIYGVPVTLNNEVIGIFGLYVNISHRKKAEEELQVRNEELDNFVYKVSHDLRAPLSSVKGLINLARLENESKNLNFPYIDNIEERIKNLDNFISDVLSHSKNLKLDLNVDKVNFEKIVAQCFNDLDYLKNAQNLEKNITIKCRSFHSDAWRITEIFRNLISNAIKYIDTEKPTSKISICVEQKADILEIVMEDNGIGIPAERLPKIFDMFYRATESSDGSGIGLYIVKNAVNKIGGKIDIDSKEGIGTKFSILLPNFVISSID